ncbi:hypothetical protein HYALB_00008577 [Hymenoscyphus albidus]|uniref:HTH CENPB-type domain-containing protein n=1 Tax=Hymenoscyphus albidus TaxID=595503 RepID=A0A9N9LHU4_9HELO|nr:hypothetical protein HYALB_00008577 [Hymenoscyphus albidus]
MSDRASKALVEASLPGEPRTYDSISKRSGVPSSTLYYRDHGRRSREEKAQGQQYLIPAEEKALVIHIKQMVDLGNPVRIKYIPSLAFSIARRRSTTSRPTKPPHRNWAQAFQKRHPELKSRRMKAMDWKRHKINIYDKILHWFEVIGTVLKDPAILLENVYNIDETGVMLCMLNSVKVLVSKDDRRDYRRQANDGDCHRHYACSESGYTDSKISFEWLKRVFDPQTRGQANNKPRVLISDGFGAHETLEVLGFCFEITFFFPCDVGVFAPLKEAYRDEVDRLFRGGITTIGKEHFTSVYSPARDRAFTKRNITSAWAAGGLFPLNPDRVMRKTPKPPPLLTVPTAGDMEVVLGKGQGKVMSFEDIEEARKKRAKIDATKGKGKRGRKRKSTVVEADEPDTEAEAEPEVAHPAKKMITGKRKRGRKHQSAIQDTDELGLAPELDLDPDPEVAQTLEALVPRRAPVARMY